MIRWFKAHWLLVYFLLGVLAFSIFVSCAAPAPVPRNDQGTPLPTPQVTRVIEYKFGGDVRCYTLNEGYSNAQLFCLQVK